METENTIFSCDDGFKLSNGNSQSVQIYDTFDDAKEASKLDEKAYDESCDMNEAECNSPVDWEV